MDDTLYYYTPSFEEAFPRACKDVGVELDVSTPMSPKVLAIRQQFYDQQARYFKNNEKEFWVRSNKVVLDAMGITNPDLKFCRAIERWFFHNVKELPYPDVFESLSKLKGKGYKLILVTNRLWPARKNLTKVGLLPLFDSYFCAGEIGISAKTSEFYRNVLETIGAKYPGELLLLDDSLETLEIARDAGLEVLRMDRTRSHVENQSDSVTTVTTLISVVNLLPKIT